MNILFYEPDFSPENSILSGDELHHAVHVLRLQLGDAVRITDGKGKLYQTQIEHIKKKSHANLRILETESFEAPQHKVILAFCPTKNIDRTEWAIEKATELGVDEVFLIQSQHSERTKVRMDRLYKKRDAAAKQSKRMWFPIIHEPQPLSSFLTLSFDNTHLSIAYVSDDHTSHLHEAATKKAEYNQLILIGPEGDFHEEEILMAKQKGYQPVSLGKQVLRTETAAIFACGILDMCR
ncbi:MAG: 16S rRNA (uracil(1498)-N(3))-methyltransferase [Cyclobacteriaceae bacterium]|nr:16S rRNA (uracil(1498)-N(3))-methyltransferase [Cyclobacteriaceae bacterium]MCH8517292.1 16S rRNA (uracil(1498)-N(3))-methyltransferase [Cyclobacteriaceae bacterium]